MQNVILHLDMNSYFASVIQQDNPQYRGRPLGVCEHLGGIIIGASKEAKKWGIRPAYAFMAGFPSETFAEVNMTIDAMRKLIRDNPDAELESISIYTALPGTPMYNLALKNGLKPPKTLEEWSAWNFQEYAEERKNPWFNEKDREVLGNLSYICTIAFVIANLTRTINKPLLRFVARIFWGYF